MPVERNEPMYRFILMTQVFVIAAVCISATSLIAQEFRIDTKVSVGNKPVSENLTLFANGVVYDFRFEPGEQRTLKEIVVFRVSPNGNTDFALIDIERKVRLRLNDRQINDLVAQMEHNPALRERAEGLIAPEFDEQWNEETGTLNLTSDRVEYQASGTRTWDVGIIDRYRTFADWYARLNAADPHKMPPFPRLALNDAMHRRGMIPDQIDLTIQPDRQFASAIRAHAEHFVVLTLTRTDREYIQRAQDTFEYQEVSRAGYFGLDQQVRNE